MFHDTWTPELVAKLSEPFDAADHFTKRQGGQEITFVAVHRYKDRLNELVGPHGWSTRVRHETIGGKLVTTVALTILGVTKENVGDEVEVPEVNERGNEKIIGSPATNAYSQAFKRVCSDFCLGAYLYDEAKRRDATNAPQVRRNSGRTPDVGSRTRQVPGDVRLPTCPDCGGTMWDNRPKKASGEFKPTAPDFKCRRKDCDGAIWPDSEHTLADENERKDNIVAAIQSAVNQIKGMSAEDGDAAQKVLDGYLQRERVTVEQLVRLQTNIQGKLDALMEEAKMATAGRTYENFSQPFPEPADDGLPF